MTKSQKLIRGFAAGAAGLLAGCLSQSDPASTPAPAHAAPSTAVSKGPAATAPSHYAPVKDPRENAILTDVIQLTNGFDKAGEAYFSPDMKWIVFQAFPKGASHYQQYVAPLLWEGDRIVGTGKPTRISGEPSHNTCGYFSPDGNSLIFGSTFGKEDPDMKEGGYQREGRDYRWAFPKGMEIYRADNWKADVEAAGGKDINLARKALTNNDAYDAEDAFSPDGKSICFCSLRSGDGDIYVMRSDGTHVVQITNKPGYDGGPFFSPDGKHLCYRSDRNKNNLLQVFVADLAFDNDGNITGVAAEHQLTNDANVNWCPSWHPDGQHLIYSTSKHGHANYELYAIRKDGTHDTRITWSTGPDVLPVFSPDGKWMMWSSRRSKDNSTQVVVARFHPPEGW